MKHTCLKTNRGGPYIFKSVHEAWVAISLRGPATSETGCIAKIVGSVGKHELRQFYTWKEMLIWATINPYLGDCNTCKHKEQSNNMPPCIDCTRPDYCNFKPL